jgi:drug/metabolite transporter (DMT)-like permease
LATLCGVLWGGLAVAIRTTQDDLPPLLTAGLRFSLATLVLSLWAWRQGKPLRIRAGQGLPIVAVGLMLFLQIALYHWGLTRTNSAHGSVLIGSHPVFVAGIAHFALAGDRLTWTKSLGLLLALAGLAAVVSGGQTAAGAALTARDAVTLVGDAIVLGSSLLLGLKTVFSKHALAGTEVAKLVLWSNALATAMFFALSFATEDYSRARLDVAGAAGLLYQGLVVAGFCFTAWAYLLRRHRASHLAVFGFLQPICGILFGVWLRGDPLSAWLLAGGAAVGIGIVLVTKT